MKLLGGLFKTNKARALLYTLLCWSVPLIVTGCCNVKNWYWFRKQLHKFMEAKIHQGLLNLKIPHLAQGSPWATACWSLGQCARELSLHAHPPLLLFPRHHLVFMLETGCWAGWTCLNQPGCSYFWMPGNQFFHIQPVGNDSLSLPYKDLGRMNHEFVLCWLLHSRITGFEVSGNTDSVLCSVLVYL